MEQNQNPQQQNVEKQQTDNFYQEYQQPIYSSANVKKKLNPVAIIVPAVILAAAAVVLLILLLIVNSGYKAAEGKFIYQMFNGLSSALSETEKVSHEPQSLSVSLEASNNQVSNYIGISNVSFITDTAVKGEDIYARMSLAAGDRILNGSFWFDGENGNILAALPEISSIYLQVSVAENEEDGHKTMIDPEEATKALKDIASQTLKAYFEAIGSPKVEGGQTLVVKNKAYTADKVVIKLNSVQCAEIVRTFLESVVNSDEAMDILCSYYGADKEEVLETLNINYTIRELEKFIEEGVNSTSYFEMTVWMLGGNIIGREVEITDDDGNTAAAFDFYQIPVSDGSIAYFNLHGEFECFNEDKVNGELHSGNIILSNGNDEVTVKYEDIAVTDRLFQGKAKIVVSDFEAFEITAELKAEGDARMVLISVPNVCRITVTAKPSQLSYEDMPKISQSEVAVIDRDGNFYENEVSARFLSDVLKFLIGANIYR